MNRQSPSIQSRRYRVTQLRTDHVHRRESASTGPGVVKATRVPINIQVTNPMDHGPANVRPFFPTPTILYYTVLYYNILLLVETVDTWGTETVQELAPRIGGNGGGIWRHRHAAHQRQTYGLLELPSPRTTTRFG